MQDCWEFSCIDWDKPMPVVDHLMLWSHIMWHYWYVSIPLFLAMPGKIDVRSQF